MTTTEGKPPIGQSVWQEVVGVPKIRASQGSHQLNGRVEDLVFADVQCLIWNPAHMIRGSISDRLWARVIP